MDLNSYVTAKRYFWNFGDIDGDAITEYVGKQSILRSLKENGLKEKAYNVMKSV